MASDWQRALVALAAAVVGSVIVVVLYFARAVFIPVALAIFWRSCCRRSWRDCSGAGWGAPPRSSRRDLVFPPRSDHDVVTVNRRLPRDHHLFAAVTLLLISSRGSAPSENSARSSADRRADRG